MELKKYNIPKQPRTRYGSAAGGTIIGGSTTTIGGGASSSTSNGSGLSPNQLSWLLRMMQVLNVDNGNIIASTNINATGDVTAKYRNGE